MPDDKYRIASDWEKSRVRTVSNDAIAERGVTGLTNMVGVGAMVGFMAAPTIFGGMARGAKRFFGTTKSMAGKASGRRSIP